MLLGDVSHPRGTHTYLRKAAVDPDAMKYVGAISFHSWNGATQAQYEAWAEMAEQLQLPLLVAELGTDPSAWRERNYDSYWYGLEELRLYQELLLYAKPQGTMYWEFTDDYSLVRMEGGEIVPTGRFWLTKHLTNLTPPASEAVTVSSDHPKVLVSAFRKGGDFTVHVANFSVRRNATLAGLPRAAGEWRAMLTTESEGYSELPPMTAADGRLSLELPARSLLTLFLRYPQIHLGPGGIYP
jgi:hypothetical protein